MMGIVEPGSLSAADGGQQHMERRTPSETKNECMTQGGDWS